MRKRHRTFDVFFIIGVTRFERATSPTPRVRATRLRHTPFIAQVYLFTFVIIVGDFGIVKAFSNTNK